MSELSVGKPLDRVDGRQKVTGKARYAAEFAQPGLAYAVAVPAGISKGRIKEIDSAEVEKMPGVLTVLTHKNAQKLKPSKPDHEGGSIPGENFLPLQSDAIFYDGQYIAVVVADSPERAVDAAERLKVSYESAQGIYDVQKNPNEPKKPKEFFGKPLQKKRGDMVAALKNAAVISDETYITPVQYHCAMEPAATLAMWEGENLTAYDATQGVRSSRKVLAEVFGLPVENVRVVCLFVGGGFGSKGFCWPHTMLAAMAAKVAKRPVQLALKRQQNFLTLGHREKTVQRVTLAADASGKLQAIKHNTATGTSTQTEFIEPCGMPTTMLYQCENCDIEHTLHTLDAGSPTPMRAPGECPGTYALECAMDELAHKLKMDPLQLRLINHADEDPDEKAPWSSKHLKECYEQAAEKFGWKKRNAQPGATRDGRFLIGHGMATATYPAHRAKASAHAKMYPDGSVTVTCATQDLGTGTYTIMTQLAADELGLPPKMVRFELGDTKFPEGPVSGGSQTAATVGSAVLEAAKALRQKLIEVSRSAQGSPLNGKDAGEIDSADGRLFLKSKESEGETYADIIRRAGVPAIEADGSSAPTPEQKEGKGNEKKHSFHSFGAVFAEVRVDPDLGEVRVSRVVGAYDVGRILNQKTARGQAIGGIVMGIGMALMEEGVRDPNNGRVLTKNLADYRVPVNADIPSIDIILLDQPDFQFNPTGARGIGEIGITGISAAIANAVFNATGKRIRELPITPEKLLEHA